MTMAPDLPLQMLRQRIAQILDGTLGAAGAADAPPLRQGPPAAPIAPALLARPLRSAKARHEAQALYRRCLEHFRARVQRGAADDDAGLAAAYFALANLAAARRLDPDESDLGRVERQFRGALAPRWLALPLAERQSAFEQFAIVGVFVVEARAAARREGEAAQARVAAAARHYLAQGLGLDAARLSLGAQGLTLEREAA